jgi:hypothetical protein
VATRLDETLAAQIALSTQRAAHMVNQLLAMARAEDTGQVLRKTSVDLAAVTRAVVRDFVPRAIERHIDLGYEGPDGQEGARLIGEPVLLGELVRNLVDNALQYTPGGGTVTARVQHDAQAHQIVLQVEDTGPGIARPNASGVPALLPRAGHAGRWQRPGPGHRAGDRPAPRRRNPGGRRAPAQRRNGRPARHRVHGALHACRWPPQRRSRSPPERPQLCISRRLRATDIRMPSPRPSDTIAVPP